MMQIFKNGFYYFCTGFLTVRVNHRILTCYAQRSSFDQPDGQFLAHANTVNDQCKTHATEWKLDSERLASLNLLITNANAVYAANSDTATHNLVTSTNKKTAFGELRHFLSLFVDYLEGTLSVPDEALAVMGLRARIRHTSRSPEWTMRPCSRW